MSKRMEQRQGLCKDFVCRSFQAGFENAASSRTSCVSTCVSADRGLVNTSTLNCCCHTQRDDGSTRAKDKSFHPRADVKMKTNLASPGTRCFQEAIQRQRLVTKMTLWLKMIIREEGVMGGWTKCK